MARPRIVFVEHQPSCPPALFAGWAGDLGAETSVCRPYAGDDLPAATGHALVILGGSMGANDDLPWFAPLASLIRDAHQAGTPTLGICLGHQLIARALGGRVTTNPAGIQLGVRDVGWTDEARRDVLFRRLAGEPARAVHWNDDVVSSVPAGSVVLARSEGAVQALRHGPAMWGVQWHPEADDAVVGRWAALDEPRLLAQGLDAAAAAAAVAAERTTLDDGAHRLVAGFVELVRQSDGPAATG